MSAKSVTLGQSNVEQAPSGTLRLTAPRKGLGWCQINGVECSWEPGPTFTSNPPISTRFCVNCGKRQNLRPEKWVDVV